MLEGLALLGASFLTVLGRVFQQKNVIGDHRILMILTAYLIALGEVTVVWNIAKIGLNAVPWVGTGGALGALSALYLHHKVTR